MRVPTSLVCRPSKTELAIGTVGPVVRALTDPYGWPGDEVVVDLAATRFATPSGLVALATAVATAIDVGYAVRVVCPADPACCSYMATAGVLQHCDELGVCLNGSGRQERRLPSRGSKVLALATLNTDSDVGAVRLGITRVMDQLLGPGGDEWVGRRGAFTGALHEMATNAVRYAPGRFGYVLAQRYFSGYQNRPYVEFAVGDSGPGIPSTLRAGLPELSGTEDHDILAQMVQKGLSSRGGGFGYNTVVEFTGSHDGRFELRSGWGALSLARGRRRPVARSLDWEWPGTVLCGAVACPR